MVLTLWPALQRVLPAWYLISAEGLGTTAIAAGLWLWRDKVALNLFATAASVALWRGRNARPAQKNDARDKSSVFSGGTR